MIAQTKKLLKPIYKFLYRVFNQNEFEKRILKRHKWFVKKKKSHGVQPNLVHTDSINEWKSEKYWQIFLSNKYVGREFAKKYGCKVPEVYWKGTKEEFIKLDLKSLPKSFVLKPTNSYSSKAVYLMNDGIELFSKNKYSLDELRKSLLSDIDKINRTDIIIEQLITDDNGKFRVLEDYRFYMFNGELAFIRYDKRSGKSYNITGFYDEKWILFKDKILKTSNVEQAFEASPALDEMIEKAKTLSKGYEIFVRIDFYSSPEGAIFGEFTPFPRMGKGFTKFGSKLLIGYWDKYCKGKI